MPWPPACITYVNGIIVHYKCNTIQSMNRKPEETSPNQENASKLMGYDYLKRRQHKSCQHGTSAQKSTNEAFICFCLLFFLKFK